MEASDPFRCGGTGDRIRQIGLGEASSAASFILLGKDGGVKSRQKRDLDLSRFYALIDTMPMRKREMRERGD